MMKRTCMAVLSAALFSLTAQAAESVNIANWSGYIADDTLARRSRASPFFFPFDSLDEVFLTSVEMEVVALEFESESLERLN